MQNPLIKTAIYGITGATLGILAGFLLTFLIAALGLVASSYSDYMDLVEMASFPAMGFGAVIGAVFSAIASLKK